MSHAIHNPKISPAWFGGGVIWGCGVQTRITLFHLHSRNAVQAAAADGLVYKGKVLPTYPKRYYRR